MSIKNSNDEPAKDVLIGRNCVQEAIRSGRPVDKVLVAAGERSGSIAVIIKRCRELKIPVKEVSPVKLDEISCHGVHQGIVAFVAAKEYCSVDDIIRCAAERNEPPFIVICDELNDPHNLGAVIRTAEAVGAHGVIIPSRRSASLSMTVAKSSAGALEHMNVARVGNIAATIDQLKKNGLWIYAADMDGECWCESDLTGAVGLVIGSEGSGVGRLIREKCDVILSLPMYGRINSLNASVAGGILMYEIARQRKGIKAR
ncbi:MAG: 23S rRNA (guanosine(2251)-2'-O)-methyltransferase RlmB [Clostridia bacterium]|nr:23S rRNA (guanosine(2251)-2'-O)-methyltransferase RlmB [Clostridia bacterium]